MRSLTAVVSLWLVLPLVGFAQEKEAPKKKANQLDDEVKTATARALEYLASKQASDGSFGDSRYPNNTALTGFALLAFMSQGHVPDQGKYGKEVAKATRYLMASARDTDGYLIGRGGNMYCHGMATLALTQLYGMTGDDEIKKSVVRAVKLIKNSQSPDGGWRYEPQPTGSDISVTIMQVMALRGAKDSGIDVPQETLNKALKYIDSCYHGSTGGYCYMPGSNAPGFARTAAGVCVIKLVGEYNKNVDRSVEFMKKTMDGGYDPHYWYGHYYASHAMHQVGLTKPAVWDEYYEHIKKKWLPVQEKDGSWNNRPRTEVGPVYHTSIAVIALSVPTGYLPIFNAKPRLVCPICLLAWGRQISAGRRKALFQSRYAPVCPSDESGFTPEPYRG